MKHNSNMQMDRLAEHLGNQRKIILKRWRAATEEAPEVSIASSLTRVQFNDHIPGVLDAYNRMLQAWPQDPNTASQLDEKEQISGHGLQRWQQGYQLRDLTREWGQLHLCVMAELEGYALENPDHEKTIMPAARNAWSKLCWDAISDSSTQYWRLNQAEATGRVHDLEQALVTFNELDQTRAAAWRETAHDLQGSLSLVTLASSLLDRKDLSEPARQEFSDLVKRGVLSVHDLLTDFMSLARLDAGLERRNLASFDAAALLTEFCKTSQPLANARGLYLKMDGPATIPVTGDQAKVMRILQNLLLNALKYTERGGVTVMWKPLEDSVTSKWMFCIQDTGPGLDDNPDSAPLATHLHEATQVSQAAEDSSAEVATEADTGKAPTLPSQTESPPPSMVPGEGVGLSIVKRLCELLNASLELETSSSAGSTFRVIFPCAYEEETE